MELLSCITYECMDIVYEIFFRYVNSALGLCLHPGDAALKLNFPYDMCFRLGKKNENLSQYPSKKL